MSPQINRLRVYAEDIQEQNQNRSNRFNRGRNRSKNRSRSIAPYSTNALFASYSTNESRGIAFYYAKESSTSNSKSTHLQGNSIVIKQESFKPSEVEYFYLGLPKNAHSPEDYIVSKKDVFYRDVHMFTQQIRRVTITKEVNEQLYLCLRKLTII